MNHEYQPSIGRLADTGTAMGTGVFALRDIAEGEVVEVAPVILLKVNFWSLEKLLRDRVFNWERLAGADGVKALAVGYGSLYNHANPANLRYMACNDGNALGFVAARSIAEGEQLTINYNDSGGDVTSSENNWFEERGITCLSPEGEEGEA